MLVMVVLTVFIAGLMVGRTPEYLGKKIQAREVQMAMLYVLVFPAVDPRRSPRSRSCSPAGLAGLNNAGPHGLSEILYAFTSTAANNGSAFAGLTGVDLLLQHACSASHAHRPLRDDRADARARRLPRREEGRAGVGRHVPGHDAALRRAARRRRSSSSARSRSSPRSRSARSSSTCSMSAGRLF